MASQSPALAISCIGRCSAFVTKRQLVGGKRAADLSRPRQRFLATLTEAAAPIVRPHFADVQPPRERTELGKLLRAVQKKDSSQILVAFLQWTDLLAKNDPGAVEGLLQLPAPTLSEVLRWLDPFDASDNAVKGLKISAGEAQYTATGQFVDRHGVHGRHRQVLAGLRTLFRIRTSSTPLTLADYEVAMRTAGAAIDLHAAREFWSNIAENGLQQWRTTKAWNEFLKAFFITEPLYYQFDRARVAVTARHLYRNRNPVHGATLEALDRQRFSINSLRREPWNCTATGTETGMADMDKEIMRDLRKRVQSRGYRAHWTRGLLYGLEMNEELLCTSIKAFSRSASLHAIKELIFNNYYGIIIENDRDPTKTTITGGHDFADSPLRPTAALLEAIAEGFGSMSHIALALQLITFISHRYSVPIPHSVWSSLLNWTYLFASKPFDTRRKLGNWISTTQRPIDVMHIWEAMNSQAGITPTFDDYDIYIKTLLVQRCLVKALAAIDEYAIPNHTSLVEAYQVAVADEVLQADALGLGAAAAPRRATLRRRKAEALMDRAHYRMTMWFKQLFKLISANRGYREGSVGLELLPKIIRDYAYFLPPVVQYRTAQGTVELQVGCGDEGVPERVAWKRRLRTTQAAKRSGFHFRNWEGSTEADFVWPTVPSMRVVETRPVPKRRLEFIAPPPSLGEKGQWWKKLEEQMVV